MHALLVHRGKGGGKVPRRIVHHAILGKATSSMKTVKGSSDVMSTQTLRSNFRLSRRAGLATYLLERELARLFGTIMRELFFHRYFLGQPRSQGI